MGIRIPERLSKFSEKAIFFILSFLVVVLLLVALEELGPFYGYSLNGTIIQVMAQAVSGIHGTMFQFSLYLYMWYAYTWILVAVAVCMMALLSLYLGFFFSPRLSEKLARSRFNVCLERVLALNIARGFCTRLVWMARETSGRLKRNHSGEAASEEVHVGGRGWKTYMWQIPLILTVALIVFMYRYALFPVPQGWDTWWYVYTIRDLQRDPTLLARLYLGRVLSQTIMYVIASVSGLMADQVTVLLTPLIGIIYMVGVYLLVLTGVKNKVVALLAALYTALTFGTIIQSAGYYSDYLAWGFAMYALTLYIKTMEAKEAKLKYIGPTAIMFVLTALSHIWAFMFLTAIALVENLLEVLTNKKFRKTIQRTLIVYSPIIILAMLRPNLVTGGLSFLGLFSASNPWEYASRENPYILLLAIAGIIAIMKHERTTYSRTVIAWTIVTSTALITGIFAAPFRIMALAPVAVSAAHGTQAISNGIMQRRCPRLIGKPVMPLIFLLCFTAMVPYTYLPESVLTPSNEAMQQLYWIEQHYGFKNYSVIVCFDVIPLSANRLYYSYYYSWGIATLGDVLYDGPLLYLIQDFPDSHGRSFQDFAGKTIIIPDQFYRMTSLEYKASQEISDLGIFEVQFKNMTQLDQIIRNASIWSEDDFPIEEWKIVPQQDYNYQITNESSILNVSVTPLHSHKWFGIEEWLSEPVYSRSSLILKVRGDIDSLDFYVGALSDTDWIALTDSSRYIRAENYTYIMLYLPYNMPVWRIRLSFLSQDVTDVESYIQLDYMALV